MVGIRLQARHAAITEPLSLWQDGHTVALLMHRNRTAAAVTQQNGIAATPSQQCSHQNQSHLICAAGQGAELW